MTCILKNENCMALKNKELCQIVAVVLMGEEREGET